MTMEMDARDDAAERAGVPRIFIDRLVELGILTLGADDRFSSGDVRRAMMIKAVEDSGIPLDGVAAAVQQRKLSFDFLDTPAYERLAALAPETFRQASERTGVTLDLLMLVREGIGMAQPSPDDRMRDDELAIVPFLQLQADLGFRRIAIERLLRVHGDTTRRLAEAEGAWWDSEVIQPAIAAGKSADAFSDPDLAQRIVAAEERAVLAMYHAHQARV